MKKISKMIRQHHERLDGKGYPQGLKGDEICLGAKVIAISDSFDAMIHKRPYNERTLSIEEAVEELKKGKGTQFDPQLVDYFLEALKEMGLII